MRRKAVLSLAMTWLLVGMAALAQGRAAPPGTPGSLKGVTAAGTTSSSQVVLQIEGNYDYQTVQPAPDTLLVDLRGVQPSGVAPRAEWSGTMVTGYHLVRYTGAQGQPAVQVRLNLSQPATFALHREATGLRITFGHREANVQTPASKGASAVVPTSPASVPAANVNRTGGGKAPAKEVVVSGVKITTGPEGETFIDVSTTAPIGFNVLQLSNPSRLVVDLESARKGSVAPLYHVDSAVVKSVRVGQFRGGSQGVVRVVADLSGAPGFDVHARPGGIRVALKPRSSPKAQAQALPAEQPRQAEKASEPAAEIPKEISTPAIVPTAPEQASATPQPVPVSEQGKAEALPVAATTAVDVHDTLPANERSPEVAAAPKPEAPTETPEAVQAARAALTLANSAGVISMAPQAVPAAAAAEVEAPKYTGEPISLNLKDVDLKDFFRLIHEISGLNIIVDPNVTGAVTLVLDAVPWDQALDIVLKNNRLGKTLEGNVLRISRVETLTAEQEAAAKLAAAREEAQPLVTVFRPVNYAKATTIATMLKSWVGGGALTKRGNILVDDRTNTLIVSDIQTQIPIIESIITRLDKKAKQVSIEARIVRANADFSRSLQSALTGAYVNPSGRTVIGGQTGTGASVSPEVLASAAPDITVTKTTTTGFGAVAISNAGARYIINAAIAAAENRSQAKTISRPTIVTQNNVPGTVTQGSQIPIQTTINNTISITYVNATLTLRVTPQVTEDGNIFLDINVQNATPGAVLTSAGPSINTQQATTQVLVPDGGTVVFGGVTITSRSKSATYVPLVGSIPIIGHLFKSSNVQDSDQELLFFVSPKVLPG